MPDTKVEKGCRRPLLWIVVGTVVVACVGILGLTWLTSRFSLPPNSTTVSHSVVVERVQKVAKLVSSETTLRDVIIYEDTWYGSTKRSLVVVTGKVLAGERISRDEVLELYRWPLEEVGALANARRDLAKAKSYAGRGREIVTYIVEGGNPTASLDRRASEQVATVVDSIIDWRDPDHLPGLHGAESDFYMKRQPPYRAKDSWFDAPEAFRPS